MNLREQRNENSRAIIEGRFITHVLQQEGRELDDDIKKRMGGFSSSFWNDRSISASGNRLTYTHLKQHRYVDMKTRESSLLGKRRKQFHNVHNRPLYGHANEIVKELTVGLTDAVVAEMMKMDGAKI